jgi:sugar diacid utilization regulator
MHFGYVWLLDDGRVPEEALEPAIEAASRIAALLYSRRLTSRIDTDLLRLLLIPNPANHSVAAETRAFGTYTHQGPVTVILVGPPNGDELSTDLVSAVTVILVGPPNGDELSTELVSDLSHAVQRASEGAPPGTVLGGVISGLGVLLAPLRHEDDLVPARRLAERVCHLASRVSDDLVLMAGIGSATALEQASHSYAEARRALQMARAIPDLGPIVAWDDLGVFRAIALLPPDEIESGVIDRRVRNLLGDSTLAETAEVFLDLGGSVQRTAERLYLHRTTLYQRLERISHVYKLDLRRNGEHRLITHLGLKLARVVHL